MAPGHVDYYLLPIWVFKESTNKEYPVLKKKSRDYKILHLLHDKDKRSRLFENLVNGLSSRGFEQIICYLRGSSDIENPLEQQGYPVNNLNQNRLRGFRPGLVFQLADLIRIYDIDLIHCQRHKPTVYGTLGALLAGKGCKVISTVHGRRRTRTLRRRLGNFLFFKRISCIVSVSNAVREDILKTNLALEPGKVTTVYNGIDVEHFENKAEFSPFEIRQRLGLPNSHVMVFVTVGRLTRVKGQEYLIEAFERVHRKFPNTCLALAGAGPLEGHLKAVSKQLRIENNVRFLGYRTDIPEILHACDCFVLPSLSEGHPLSLLEAMAAEKFTIATRVGGVPEILDSPEFGFTVHPASVTHLADAMEKVCKMDKTALGAYGIKLKKRVENSFTTAKMVSSTAELYRKIISAQKA